MRWPERISTARLTLRRPRSGRGGEGARGDAESIFGEYAQDPEVTRYLVWRPHADLQDTRAFLARCDEGWRTGRELAWALTVTPEERVVGMIALRPNGHQADIGYVLARRLWNQGLVTEAGQGLLRLAFEDPALFRIWAVCDVANLASARMLEKIGMQREGLLRRWIVHPNISPEPRDVLVYARVREPK